MLYFLQKSFVKLFEFSNIDAFLLGPKTFVFNLFILSTSPSTSGCSGPTTTKSIFFCFINFIIAL